MRRLLALPAVSLFLAFGCSPTAQHPVQEADLDAERAALIEADRAMFEAYSTSDSPLDALMAHFVDDANVLAPDNPGVTHEQCQGYARIGNLFCGGNLRSGPGRI